MNVGTDPRLWVAVDDYFNGLLNPPDAALEAALRDAEEAGLPPINVTPAQGKLLHLLARLVRAHRILELGTLGGYSAIWLARALPADGRLVTLELDPRNARVAQANLERAGVADRVEVKLGRALESLRELVRSGEGPFDLVFIDADKQNYPDYFKTCLQLVHAGSLIVADNVVREGEIIDVDSPDPAVHATRQFNEIVARESRVSAVHVQTVGPKGYDGFVLAIVND